MFRILALAAAAATALAALPVAASPSIASPAAIGWAFSGDIVARHGADDIVKERRHGRDDGAAHAKRGRGGHDDGAGDDKRRPRVPGGSGCDSPRDVIEHPECRR